MRRFGDFPERRNAEGKMICKWTPCQNLIPKGRVYFCSEQCSFEVCIRRDAAFLRARTKERDHGVCAGCGIDTEQLKRILRHTRESMADLLLGKDRHFGNLYWFSKTMKREFGFRDWQRVEGMCKWQADHIVEIVDGGSPYLDNIQTLCVPCHKEKTKLKAGQRAQVRRERKRDLFAELAA